VLLSAVRKVLAFEMTIAEWIGTAIMLAVPYLLVGVVWTVLQRDHLRWGDLDGVVSVLASVVSWPVLLVSTVCMT
jgi:hypothetical protein